MNRILHSTIRHDQTPFSEQRLQENLALIHRHGESTFLFSLPFGTKNCSIHITCIYSLVLCPKTSVISIVNYLPNVPIGVGG